MKKINLRKTLTIGAIALSSLAVKNASAQQTELPAVSNGITARTHADVIGKDTLYVMNIKKADCEIEIHIKWDPFGTFSQTFPYSGNMKVYNNGKQLKGYISQIKDSSQTALANTMFSIITKYFKEVNFDISDLELNKYITEFFRIIQANELFANEFEKGKAARPQIQKTL